MDIKQLHTFSVACDTLSFTKTAAQLSYAQSSVSTQIHNLEAELGGPLFHRLGRNLSLTDRGERLRSYAAQILTLVDETRAAVSNDAAQAESLIITAPETLCAYRLPGVLRRFRQDFPDVSLQFLPTPSGNRGWQDLLRRGQIDIVIRLGLPISSPNIHVETLTHEPLQIVAHASHPLAKLSNIRPNQLRNETFLLTERNCSYRGIFERILQSHAVYPQRVIEFHSVEAIKQCAIGGMGLAMLPTIAVEQQLAAGDLAGIDFDMTASDCVTQLAWHKDLNASSAFHGFVNIVRQEIGSQRAA